MFSVVEFTSDHSVAVIPDVWKEELDEDIYCYWPPNNAQSLVRKRSLPDKIRWIRLQVHRVFKSSVDYITAQKLMIKAQNTSCPELSDASISGKKQTRLKRPPLRLLESDSDITDIEDSDINNIPQAKKPTLPSPPKRIEKRRNLIKSTESEPSWTCEGRDRFPRAGFYKLPEEARVARSASYTDSTCSMMPQHLDFCSTPNMDVQCEGHRVKTNTFKELPGSFRSPMYTDTNTLLTMPQNLDPAGTANGNRSQTDVGLQNFDLSTKGQNSISNNNFQLNVLMKLDKIIEKQEEHSLLFRRLLQTREDSTATENPIPAISQLSDLMTFDDKLRVNEELQRKMGKYLSALGGPNYGETVRRMMRKITSSDVWSHFSLKGRKGKRRLEDLSVYRVLLRAIMKSQPGTTSMDAESQIAETLKHAPGLVRRKANRATPQLQDGSMDLFS
ncbi:uncharacterized protein [Danio rerio]|uniref:Uncharacterized protein n=1 Tax=Danio rerio TaxID=7955 RepID=A0AC58HAN6_DANRE